MDHEIYNLQGILTGLAKEKASLVDRLGKVSEAMWLAERRLHELQRKVLEVDRLMASLSREQMEAIVAMAQ